MAPGRTGPPPPPPPLPPPPPSEELRNPWATPALQHSANELEEAQQKLEIDDNEIWASKWLRKAVTANHISEVQEKLDEGAPVNGRDRAGKTALHYAAGQGSVELIELLLKYRADVNAADECGGLPVDEAEHWSVRLPKYGDALLRTNCLAALDVLSRHGGVRSEPANRIDGPMHVKRIARLEEEAKARGITCPWHMPVYKALADGKVSEMMPYPDNAPSVGLSTYTNVPVPFVEHKDRYVASSSNEKASFGPPMPPYAPSSTSSETPLGVAPLAESTCLEDENRVLRETLAQYKAENARLQAVVAQAPAPPQLAVGKRAKLIRKSVAEMGFAEENFMVAEAGTEVCILCFDPSDQAWVWARGPPGVGDGWLRCDDLEVLEDEAST